MPLYVNDGKEPVDVDASATDVQVFTSSGDWIKPATGTLVIIEAWGGGGGGYTSSNRGGGGGGAYLRREMRLSEIPGNVTVTIGNGGSPGFVGGTTTFGIFLTAYGGGAGGNAIGGGGGGALGPGASGDNGRGGAPSSIAREAGNGPHDASSGQFGGGWGASNSTGEHGRSAVYGGGGGASNSSDTDGGPSIFGGGGGAGGSGGGNSPGTSVHGGDGGVQGGPGQQPGGGGGSLGSGGDGQVIVYVIP